MIVKKLDAPTETEAILKAREELGSNAVVLNVKTLRQRGIFRLFRKDKVEITAALEENDLVNTVKSRKQDLATSGKNAPQQGSFNVVVDEKTDVSSDTAILEEKLDSLHDMLKKQINAGNQVRQTAAQPQEATAEETAVAAAAKEQPEEANGNIKFLQLAYNKLIDNEVDERFANQIIGEISSSIKKESNIDSLLSSLYQKIILKLGEPAIIKTGDKRKVVFFIGPTGVGKTTTIAKLASDYKLNKGCSVAFVTADTYRIAAVEQLNTYASIIGCPVQVAYSADELEECIDELKDFDLVMVDTAGRSHNSDEQMDELMEMYKRLVSHKDEYDLECYLTLSMTTKYRDLVKIVDSYKDIKGYSVIFTKLDETCGFGNILNVRMYTDASLSYTTSGQNVPNDIEVIDEQRLAKQLLGG